MNLSDLLTGNTGNDVAQKAEQKFGISKNQVIALMAVAAPLIISYLKNKSQDANEAEALNKTLDKHHNGNILDDTSELENRQEEGNSILSHIFGNQKNTVENKLADTTGISMDKIGPILAMLAPVIMGFIGKQKQQNNVQAGGIGDLLGGILGNFGGASGGSNPLNDILGGVLGGNKGESGNPIGDILGNILGGDSKDPNKKEGGGIGDVLGGIFGK
jgi:hypothetical protein